MSSVFRRAVSVVFLTLGLAACSSTPGPTVVLPNTTTQPLYIKSIKINGLAPGITSSFLDNLGEVERTANPSGTPVDLEINVVSFDHSNAGRRFLIGGDSTAETLVRLRDPATDRLYFEQLHEDSTGSGLGGVLGVIVQLASDEEAIFGRRLVEFVDEKLIMQGVQFDEAALARFGTATASTNQLQFSANSNTQDSVSASSAGQTATVAAGAPATTTAASSTQVISTNVAPSLAPTAPIVAAQPTVFVAFTSAWDESGARSHWSNLARAYPGQLGAYSPAIRPFSDGSGNTYYSVMIDRPVSLSEAENICYAVRRLDPGCSPIAQ